MKHWKQAWLFVIVTFVGGMLIFGCGTTGNKAGTDINGMWKSTNGGGTLVIQLAGEKKSIEIDGKTLPVSASEEKGDVITLSVKDQNGAQSTWTISKLWNDNGSEFSLRIIKPDGSHDKFVHATHS